MTGQLPDPCGAAKMPGPRMVVGLGNPGPEYVATRHNVGFEALDLYAHRLGASPETLVVAGRRLANCWHFAGPLGPVVLLWPLTYMNLSGEAVVAALREFAVEPAQTLVLSDDFHLDLGALRVRASGSAGGHNGLGSIEDCLGSTDYPRLRIGVGQPRGEVVDFVLERFRASEEEVVQETLLTASWAAEDWAKGASVEDLQARYNRRKPQA